MMKKLVGNAMSVLLEVLMWITFVGCTIGGLVLGYSEAKLGPVGVVGGLVLGAIVGMCLNTVWWLISVFQEIRNYSKKWLGKYKDIAEPSSPHPMQMPDFHFHVPSLLVDNGRKIIIFLVSLALLVGVIVIAKNFANSPAKEKKAVFEEVEAVKEAKEVKEVKGREKAIATTPGSFTDTRDDKTYKTIKIGNQTWIAQNLNYDVGGSKCYGNDESNCQKYGRLYNWFAAVKACPSGWHLPSNSEWDILYRSVDGTSGTESPYKSETAGKYLKAKSGWNSFEGYSGNGTDNYGFAALPGGLGNSSGGFSSLGNYGNWWSSTEDDGSKSYKHNNAGWESEAKNKLFSVRCVGD